ncbi:MAG: hypothetical protein VX077_10585 [Pseudomonadota bacterium]|nr:hypothetical protein [Pseudomonadota bacterium]
MKTMILSGLAAATVVINFGATVAQAQPRDCEGFSNRADFFSSIGLDDAASFWSSVATECEASNWPEEERRTVKESIRTLAEEAGYERPEREVVEAAAEAAGVELPARRPGKGKGKGKGMKGSRGDR